MSANTPNSLLERFYQLIEQERGAKMAWGLRWHIEHYLFPGIELAGKRFLDIGGGTGTYTFYALCRGAREAVCLEPEAAGSAPGMKATFQKRMEHLGVQNAILVPLTFQEYEPDGVFDILFCHNAINHLDEQATIHLHQDPSAQEIYLALFQKMNRLCAPGGYLIIADASRNSLYAWLRVKGPLTPTIEWHKHQPPQVWERLLIRAGFRKVALRWRSPASLGRLGRLLIGNRFVNFFLWSHFCMVLKKEGSLTLDPSHTT